MRTTFFSWRLLGIAVFQPGIGRAASGGSRCAVKPKPLHGVLPSA